MNLNVYSYRVSRFAQVTPGLGREKCQNSRTKVKPEQWETKLYHRTVVGELIRKDFENYTFRFWVP